MPSYTAKPTAEHVQKLAKRLEERWSRQAILDKLLLSYYMMGNDLDTASDGTKGVKPFRSGILGQLQKEDAALLVMNPALHVVPPDPDDEDEKAHCNDLLEPWSIGVWHESQVEPVWPRQPLDLIVFRRSWSNVYPDPRLWANDEYQEMVKGMQEAKKKGDAEKVADLRKKISDFRRDILPIRWRYVSPQNTWTTFNGEIPLPEVVELRKMTRQEIADAFGEDATEDIAGSDTTEVDVIEYANHEWCVTVVGSGSPKIVRDYKHGLGCNPYVLIEAELLPENDLGLRWAGSAFHAQNIVDTFDELLTERRNVIRENTRTPILIKHDREAETGNELVGGRPKNIPYKPGTQIDLWTTESIELGPVSVLNPELNKAIEDVKQLIQQTQIRPVQRGQVMSGQSNNLFTTAVQISEREFDPIVKAMAKGAKEIVKRFFRCVIALNKGYDDVDKVAIYDNYKGKGLLEVGPKDVQGRERAVQPTMSKAIPVDRNIQINAAKGLKELGIADETVYDEELGYANPLHQIKLANQETLKKAGFQLMAQEVTKRAGQLLTEASPDELAKAEEMFTGAPSDLQEFLGSAVPGTFRQAQSNEMRDGVPQMAQEAAVATGGVM